MLLAKTFLRMGRSALVMGAHALNSFPDSLYRSNHRSNRKLDGRPPNGSDHTHRTPTTNSTRTDNYDSGFGGTFTTDMNQCFVACWVVPAAPVSDLLNLSNLCPSPRFGRFLSACLLTKIKPTAFRCEKARVFISQ